MQSKISRRETMMLAAGALVGSSPAPASAQEQVERAKPTQRELCVFTKPFNSLSFSELADRIAELGFTGIEAPIRKGGHIEPEAVQEQLPELVSALKSRNLDITVLTSDINDATDPLAIRVLRTAASLGIKRYRMKYLRYDLDRSILQQIEEWRPQLRDLADLNLELGITGLYQNHAGANYVGAALWDVPRLLEGISTEAIGLAYDIRHAIVEGGTSWKITFNRVRSLINVVYVKDFAWVDGRPSNVPLGTGKVSSEFFGLLANAEFTGPISLHEEYLDHRQPDLVPRHIAAIERDYAKLRSWL